MVRHQTWRRRKYEAKIDGVVSERRVDAYGAAMVKEYTAITPLMVEKEEQAKTTILEPAGVPTSQIPFYLNFMRECCKCARNFTSTTRNDKCYDLICTYRDKGLRVNLLYRLAKLCGCYPIGYEYYDPSS